MLNNLGKEIARELGSDHSHLILDLRRGYYGLVYSAWDETVEDTLALLAHFMGLFLTNHLSMELGHSFSSES